MLTAIINILRRFWLRIAGIVAFTGILIWQFVVNDLLQNLTGPIDWTKVWQCLFQWVDDAAKYLSKPVPVPFFFFVILCVSSILVALYAGWFFWRRLFRVDWNDTTSIEQKFRSFEWRGIRWEWYYVNLRVALPNPICPKCHADMLHEQFDLGETHVRYSCPNDCSRAEFRGNLRNNIQVREAARSEVLRHIRSKADVMEFS